MAAKIFEVGDVLPQTSQLRITSSNSSIYALGGTGQIKTDNGNFTLVDYEVFFEDDAPRNFIIDGINYYSAWYSQQFVLVDTSSWSLSKRTVSTVSGIFTDSNGELFWEDVAPSGHSITYEENGGSTVTDLTEQTALPSPLPTTTKANHVFAGWYYDNLFAQKANAGDELTTNVTLYAKWYTPTTWCEDIADAIRKKEGSSGNIKHVDFPERILAIESAVEMSQDDYDALTTPDTNTYYLIVEEE